MNTLNVHTKPVERTSPRFGNTPHPPEYFETVHRTNLPEGTLVTHRDFLEVKILPPRKSGQNASIQNTSTGKLIGTLDADGYFSAEESPSGNALDTNTLNVPLFPAVKGNPFFETLASKMLHLAEANHVGHWLTQHHGTTAKDTPLMVLDASEDHKVFVDTQIQGRKFGLAPRAHFVSICTKDNQYYSEFDLFNPEGFDNFLINHYAEGACQQINRLENAFKLMKAQKLPTPKVLLIPEGYSRFEIYQFVENKLLPQLQQANVQYRSSWLQHAPKMVQQFDAMTQKDPVKARQAIVNIIDDVLDNHPALQTAKAKIATKQQEVYSEAKRMGITLIFPTGNEQDAYPSKVKIQPTAFHNLYASPQDCLLVGASNPHGSPWDFKQYTPTHLSTQGKDGKANPNFVSPGALVRLDNFGINMGTTHSATEAACILAHMLEANPYLTPDERVKILEESCENPNNHPPQAVGHGYLNPSTAIEQAKSSK